MTIGVLDGPAQKAVYSMQFESKEIGEKKMPFDEASLMEPPKLPLCVTVYGGPKVGKSEFEATFSGMDASNPDMIVMCWEHPGPTLAGRKDLRFTPLIKSFEQGMDFLKWLYVNPGNYKKLAVDTITRMSRVYESEIVAVKNKDGSQPRGMADAMGGFGKAYVALAAMHEKFVLACEALRQYKGFEIIWNAHSDVQKFSPPDGETYNYYSLDMHEDSAAHYINNSDIIAYLDQRVIATEGDDGKIKVRSTDQRILRVKASAAYVSGNRYGITDDIVFEKGKNPLDKFRI